MSAAASSSHGAAAQAPAASGSAFRGSAHTSHRRARSSFRKLQHLHEGAIDADSTSLEAAGVSLRSFTRARTTSAVDGSGRAPLRPSRSHDDLTQLQAPNLSGALQPTQESKATPVSGGGSRPRAASMQPALSSHSMPAVAPPSLPRGPPSPQAGGSRGKSSLVGGSGRDLRLGLLRRMQAMSQAAPAPAPPALTNPNAAPGRRRADSEAGAGRGTSVAERRARYRKKKGQRAEHTRRLRDWQSKFEAKLRKRSREASTASQSSAVPAAAPIPPSPQLSSQPGPHQLPTCATLRAVAHDLQRARRVRVCCQQQEKMPPPLQAAWEAMPRALQAAISVVHLHRSSEGWGPYRALETDMLAAVPVTRVSPLWAPSAAAARCTSCGVEFSMLVRKHHCRRCGLVMCHDCTPFRDVSSPPVVSSWWGVLAGEPPDAPQPRKRTGSVDSAPAAPSNPRMPAGLLEVLSGASALHALDAVQLDGGPAGDAAASPLRALTEPTQVWSRLCVHCHGMLRGVVVPHPQVQLSVGDTYHRLHPRRVQTVLASRDAAQARALKALAGTPPPDAPDYVLAAAAGKAWRPGPGQGGRHTLGTSDASPARKAFEVGFWLQAVAQGLSHEVQHWMAMGLPVNAGDRATGRCALHVAALYGQKQVLERLVREYGADVGAIDAQGSTPLHLAAAAGRPATVRSLLAFDAPQDVPDADGFTPYDLAQRFQHTAVLALLDDAHCTAAASQVAVAQAKADAAAARRTAAAEPGAEATPRPPFDATPFQDGSARCNLLPADALRQATRGRPLPLPPRARLLEAGIARLDPAAQALQANLMAVRNSGIRACVSSQWRQDATGLTRRARWHELGFLTARRVHASAGLWSKSARDILSVRLVADIWRRGHCLGPDVDYQPLVAAAAGVDPASAEPASEAGSAADTGSSDEEEAPGDEAGRFGMDVDWMSPLGTVDADEGGGGGTEDEDDAGGAADGTLVVEEEGEEDEDSEEDEEEVAPPAAAGR